MLSKGGISLQTKILLNPQASPQAVFQSIIKFLQRIQVNLPEAYYFDCFLLETFKKVCRGVKGLDIACNIRIAFSTLFIDEVGAVMTNNDFDSTQSQLPATEAHIKAHGIQHIHFADLRFMCTPVSGNGASPVHFPAFISRGCHSGSFSHTAD